jgi:hypothetical protein
VLNGIQQFLVTIGGIDGLYALIQQNQADYVRLVLEYFLICKLIRASLFSSLFDFLDYLDNLLLKSLKVISQLVISHGLNLFLCQWFQFFNIIGNVISIGRWLDLVGVI